MHFNNFDTLCILKSLGANFPIIQAIGCEPEKLFCIICGHNQMKRVMDILPLYEAPKISEFMAFKDIAKVLSEANSEFIIYPFSATRKGTEVLNFLKTSVKLWQVGSKKLRSLPLVISETPLKMNDTEDMFVVRLSDSLSDIRISVEDIVPPDDQIEVVLDKISEIDFADEEQNEKALMAAVCFLYPSLKKAGLAGKFKQLLELSAKLVALDDDNRDCEKADELFISELYTWQEKAGFFEVYELPNLDMHTEGKLGSVILFDDEFLYMKEQLFTQITASLLDVFAEAVLKDALAMSKILCPSCQKTYTVKMGYRNIAGGYSRTRMLRFRRDRLTRVGEVDFIEACLMAGKGGKNAD